MCPFWRKQTAGSCSYMRLHPHSSPSSSAHTSLSLSVLVSYRLQILCQGNLIVWISPVVFCNGLHESIALSWTLSHWPMSCWSDPFNPFLCYNGRTKTNVLISLHLPLPDIMTATVKTRLWWWAPVWPEVHVALVRVFTHHQHPRAERQITSLTLYSVSYSQKITATPFIIIISSRCLACLRLFIIAAVALLSLEWSNSETGIVSLKWVSE